MKRLRFKKNTAIFWCNPPKITGQRYPLEDWYNHSPEHNPKYLESKSRRQLWHLSPRNHLNDHQSKLKQSYPY